MAFVEQAPREIVDESKDLIGPALATGGDFGLLAPGGPGIAQRAPLRKAGFITKEQQRLALAGSPYNVRPPGLPPLQTLGLVEVIGHKAGFLIGKSQVVQQGTEVVRMVLDAKVTVDQVLNDRRVPTSRGINLRLADRLGSTRPGLCAAF